MAQSLSHTHGIEACSCIHLFESLKNLSGAKSCQLQLRKLIVVTVDDNLQRIYSDAVEAASVK